MRTTYDYARTGDEVEIDGKRLIVPASPTPTWKDHAEKLHSRWIKVCFVDSNIPVMTTDKVPDGLYPIWLVSADSEWSMDLHDGLRSLADKLRLAAPQHAVALYNLKFKWTDYHGHQYLQGTADAYGRGEPESVDHFARKYVGV